MTTVNAIIFDLDGVLVNTISMHNQAWRNVAQAGGRTLTDTDLESLRGVRRIEGLKFLFPDMELTPQQIDRFIDIKHNSFIEALEQSTADDILIDNATELIESALSAGLKLGIASSSINANRVIERIGLTAKFGIIANGAVVNRSKPAPDIFVWTAGALGVSPRHAIVFEDSVAGIKGANQAGMRTVGIANPDTQATADIFYAQLSAVKLDNVFNDLDLVVNNQSTEELTR